MPIIPTNNNPLKNTKSFEHVLLSFMDTIDTMNYTKMRNIIMAPNPLRMALLAKDKKKLFCDLLDTLNNAEKSGIPWDQNREVQKDMKAQLLAILKDPELLKIRQNIGEEILTYAELMPKSAPRNVSRQLRRGARVISTLSLRK